MPLVSMRQLLDHAAENGYGIPAFNVNNLEQVQAVMQAASEVGAPVILQASAGALEGNYDFFLVDLNRMNFHDTMDFDSRMKNLSHLTPKKEMIAVMSNEYSKLYPAQSEAEIFGKMWFYTNDFQERFARKRRLKKKLKFWKS